MTFKEQGAKIRRTYKSMYVYIFISLFVKQSYDISDNIYYNTKKKTDMLSFKVIFLKVK